MIQDQTISDLIKIAAGPFPEIGSPEEIERFRQIQQDFRFQFESVFPGKLSPKTVIVIPSLTLDQEILEKVNGVVHYEERLLCLLMLLRMPHTHLIYVTSVPVDPVIIDYYLHLLPGITRHHATLRLSLLSCYDASRRPLTAKILERPRLIERIRKCIPAGHLAHIACFNVTELERTLAVRLHTPIYGCDPEFLPCGTKSGSREVFRKCGISIPPGYENLKTEKEILDALAALKKEYPQLRKAVVKMNDGFGGEGNAVFTYDDRRYQSSLNEDSGNMNSSLLVPVAEGLSYEEFIKKFEEMGGIVEAYIDGEDKRSPSVQCRINPVGLSEVLSTHDQVFDENSDQVFAGAEFPASSEYAVTIAEEAFKVSEALLQQGVLGRFAIDFISVRENSGWKHYAIEINLRKGGTTHPYLMLQFLTDGNYDSSKGKYYTASGQERFYFASDNLKQEHYKGLTPHDLVDIAIDHNLMYDGSAQEGVMFHLLGALSQFGKIGVVCIGTSPERARSFYQRTVEVLDKEGKLSNS
jgi:hypothetical protein